MIVDQAVIPGFVPVDWMQLEHLPAVEPVIPDLLNEGEFGSLVGQAEAGKSLLALEIAAALALGLPVLGHPARPPMPVMYVDMENPQQELADRLRRMGYAPSELESWSLHYFSFPDVRPLDTADGGQQLALAAAHYEPKLIILDTISRMVEGKEDSADTWRNLYNCTMLPLRQQGRTVLRLDHQGHDSARGARGSSAKRDDVDVAWIIKCTRGNNVTLTRNKGRGLSHPEKITLRRQSNPTCHVPVVGDKIAECMDALDKLGIALDASRDEAATALRQNGHQFSNDVIGKGLKARRPSPSPRTANHGDE